MTDISGTKALEPEAEAGIVAKHDDICSVPRGDQKQVQDEPGDEPMIVDDKDGDMPDGARKENTLDEGGQQGQVVGKPDVEDGMGTVDDKKSDDIIMDDVKVADHPKVKGGLEIVEGEMTKDFRTDGAQVNNTPRTGGVGGGGREEASEIEMMSVQVTDPPGPRGDAEGVGEKATSHGMLEKAQDQNLFGAARDAGLPEDIRTIDARPAENRPETELAPPEVPSEAVKDENTSTQQREPHPLQHLLDRVLIPEITGRIFLNCDNTTRATCMRVCQTFYDIVAPLIYTNVEIAKDNWQDIIHGSESPLPGSKSIARKNKLLSLVKHVSIYWHWNCSISQGRCFVNVKVVYISTYSKCTCGEQCDVCNVEYYDEDQQCLLLDNLRPEKLVIANLRSKNAKYVFKRCTNKSTKIVTLIISPDQRGLSALSTVIPSLFYFYQGITKFRVIFAPWSEKTHSNTMEIVQQGRDNDDNDDDKSPAELSAFVDALKKLSIFDGSLAEVAIYFIEGATFSYPWNRDRTVLFPDTDRIRDQVMDFFQESLEEGEELKTTYSWKDRSHYLREGWTYEIDPRELRRWRREEYGAGLGYDSDAEDETDEDVQVEEKFVDSRGGAIGQASGTKGVAMPSVDEGVVSEPEALAVIVAKEEVTSEAVGSATLPNSGEVVDNSKESSTMLVDGEVASELGGSAASPVNGRTNDDKITPNEVSAQPVLGTGEETEKLDEGATISVECTVPPTINDKDEINGGTAPIPTRTSTAHPIGTHSPQASAQPPQHEVEGTGDQSDTTTTAQGVNPDAAMEGGGENKTRVEETAVESCVDSEMMPTLSEPSVASENNAVTSKASVVGEESVDVASKDGKMEVDGGDGL